MARFYQSIAPHYDHIFPTRPPQVQLVSARTAPVGKILDLGCATGGLSIALAKRGFDVTGIDLDAQMVVRAERKLANSTATARFAVADMTNPHEPCWQDSYDAIICLGNTLAHLQSAQLSGLLGLIANRLSDRGVFICQIVNYDRVDVCSETELPLIDNDAIRFERRYIPGSSKSEVRFHTKLLVKATEESITNEIPLYPLPQQQLDRALHAAGLGTIEYYGSFKAEAFEPAKSFPLVAVARR